MKSYNSINLNKINIWVIRAGKLSEDQELFFRESVIALVEAGMGDLNLLKPIREHFYEKYRIFDPGNTIVGIKGIGGKYFRFVHEMKIDDMVLFPSRKDNLVYIGNVISNYIYAPKVDTRFPHLRKVDWQSYFQKSELSVFAGRELGAARTFFCFKNNKPEIFALLRNGISKQIDSIQK